MSLAALNAEWIGFAGALLVAAVGAFVAFRQARLSRQHESEVVLSRYREPLAAAAFDLQSRLYNILRQDFFNKYPDGVRAEEAVTTTLYRIAQYFGWTEIMRRDIQFLSFPEDEDTREVATLQFKISRMFLDDDYGHALMIWADEQRALGELMIVEEHGKVLCMGYARFRERCGDTFAPWLERLRKDLGDDDATKRMRDVQHKLCELVRALDRRGVRYTSDLDLA
jgi:hypothetical protein